MVSPTALEAHTSWGLLRSPAQEVQCLPGDLPGQLTPSASVQRGTVGPASRTLTLSQASEVAKGAFSAWGPLETPSRQGPGHSPGHSWGPLFWQLGPGRAPGANRRAGHSGLHGQPVDLVPRKPLLGLRPHSFSFLQSGPSANLPDPLVWVLGPGRDRFCLIHRSGKLRVRDAQTAESLWDG